MNLNGILSFLATLLAWLKICTAMKFGRHGSQHYLDFGLVLLILKVFDHIREPHRQTVVTGTLKRQLMNENTEYAFQAKTVVRTTYMPFITHTHQLKS